MVEEREIFVRGPDGCFYVLKDGKKTRYETMDDMPPELRNELESRLRKTRECSKTLKESEVTVTKKSDGSFIIHRNNRVERYSSYNALPPELRKDVDLNEELQAHGLMDEAVRRSIEIRISGTNREYEVDGKVYDDIDSIPDPVAREIIRDSVRKYDEARRRKELDTFRQTVTIKDDKGTISITDERWCPSCSRSVTPAKAWFGRKKCPNCGTRIF